MSMDKELLKIEEEVAQKSLHSSKEDLQNYRFDSLIDEMIVEDRVEEALEYKWKKHIYNSEGRKVVKVYDRDSGEFKLTLKEAA